MTWTFTMVCVAWVFFRAESVTEAMEYVERMILISGGLKPVLMMWLNLTLLSSLLVIELIISGENYMKIWRNRRLRWTAYFILGVCVLLNWEDQSTTFIYFQF